MSRCRETIPIDDYVFDVLMRDIVGHDRQPAAYLSLRPSRARDMETNSVEFAHAR